jgi:multidrug transporter EmrE-like cation transporter
VDKKQNLIALSAAGGYGIVNGLGNLIALICLLKIEPSAQYPIITGGCIAFSMIFGVIFFKEKITKRKILSLVAILLGTAILLF